MICLSCGWLYLFRKYIMLMSNSGYTTIVLYEYDHFSYPIHICIMKSCLIIFEYEYEYDFLKTQYTTMIQIWKIQSKIGMNTTLKKWFYKSFLLFAMLFLPLLTKKRFIWLDTIFIIVFVSVNCIQSYSNMNMIQIWKSA